MMDKVEALRADLKAEVEHLQLTPRSVLVVHPRGETPLNPIFNDWLQETLNRLVPGGTRMIYLRDNSVGFREIQTPTGESDDYLRGWYDALTAIQNPSTEIVKL